ncbi:MAG: flagellar motor switch protein FliN [Nitrospinota bacterium]|nr:flagellar motor switch protein FliN [Nitrospinota bacterium]
MGKEKDIMDDDADAETLQIVEKTDEEKIALTKIKDDLAQYLDIPLVVNAELGRASITIREVLKLNDGAVLELDKLVGEPMEIFINGLLIARGEVVVVNERFGIRVTDVIDPMEITRQNAGTL